MPKNESQYFWKKFGRLIHIFEPVYTRNYYAVCGVSAQKFRRELKKHLGIELSPEETNGNGKFLVYEREGQEIGIIWSDDLDVHLAHECFHAAHWCLSNAGLRLSDLSEEAYAYYQSFLVRSILRKE